MYLLGAKAGKSIYHSNLIPEKRLYSSSFIMYFGKDCSLSVIGVKIFAVHSIGVVNELISSSLGTF